MGEWNDLFLVTSISLPRGMKYFIPFSVFPVAKTEKNERENEKWKFIGNGKVDHRGIKINIEFCTSYPIK